MKVGKHYIYYKICLGCSAKKENISKVQKLHSYDNVKIYITEHMQRNVSITETTIKNYFYFP